MKKTVQLSTDLSATILTGEDVPASLRHKTDVFLELSERGMEGLGGYHWETTIISDAEALRALQGLLNEAIPNQQS